MPEITFHDCHAVWDGTSLSLGNQAIARRWKIQNGLLYNTSLRDAVSGKELLVAASAHPSPCPEFPVTDACRQFAIEAAPHQAAVTSAPALRVRLRADYDNLILTTTLLIYPGLPVITTWIEIEGGPAPSLSAEKAALLSGVESAPPKADAPLTDLCEYYQVEHIHRVLGAVSFMDHTDNKDNLAHARRDLLTIAALNEYQGNLFYLENQLDQTGAIFIKEAPLPYARPIPAAKDLTARAGQMAFSSLGAGNDSPRASYPFTTLLYSGGRAGRVAALQDYQRALRQLDPERDVIIWQNNWGDRNKDGRMSEAFLLAELEAIAETGIDQLHPDDGWEKGVTMNSTVAGGRWEGQWAEEPDFWLPHPQRLPNGWGPVANAAKRRNVKLGIWYNVDSHDDYGNWRRDVQVLLGLYRDWDFRYFKFDGVTVRSKRGEANLQRVMHEVIQKSGGEATVLLDVTAGVRPGYWQGIPYSVLFLENRYTDWHKYWPHCTLRNLWQLAEFVDPNRLVVEFLNNERNAAKYVDDPLAPIHYAPDYLFASVMFARPLAWFEASYLSAAYKTRLKSIIAAYKPHRAQIARGHILPIGQEPSGFSWTGFQSQIPGAESGYVIALRELHDSATFAYTLSWLVPGRYRFTQIAGQGADFDAEIGESGETQFALPGKLNYALYRYERVNTRR
jgi:alpha-galactosidase